MFSKNTPPVDTVYVQEEDYPCLLTKTIEVVNHSQKEDTIDDENSHTDKLDLQHLDCLIPT